MATEALVFSGLPFNTFDNANHPAMVVFLNALNPSYAVPHRNRIASSLLLGVYNDVHALVTTRIAANKFLNFTCDELTANNGDRVYNLSVNFMNNGSYHIRTLSMKSLAANADTMFSITRDEINKVIIEVVEKRRKNTKSQDAPEVPLINSLATDTCSTMRLMHVKLAALPEFKDTFFVLCDSHGLQLLIKDILSIPQWAEVMRKVNCVAVYFKRAKRALGLLRDCMDEVGERSGFTLACITRWGSHYGVVRGILRATRALRKFASRAETASLQASSPEVSRLGKQTQNLLTSRAFWEDVELLEKLLRPIHRAQVQSESDLAGVSSVVDRWLSIRADLKDYYEDNGL